ncbi:MAG: PAS domain S-box protein [Polyangiales bacterium]
MSETTSALLDGIFALTSDAVVVVRDGTVEDVNPAFERASGLSRDACVGRAIAQLRVDGDDAAILRADGTRVPVRIERRQLEGLSLEVMHDLTATRALAELDARVRTIAELATDYHYAADFHDDGNISIRWLSDSYTRITGWTVDDVRAHRMGVDFVVPEDLPLLLAKSKCTRSGEPAVAEYRTRTRSGGEVWVRDFTVPVKNDAGRVIAMVGAAKDITDEKRAELHLRESEARYRLLAENSYDVISTIDANGVARYVSPSVRRVLGYEPEELVGKVGFGMSHPEEREQRITGFARLVDSGSPTPLLVTRVRHKDGRYVHLESNTQAVRDEAGRLIEVHSTARDVTARVEAEQALARASSSFRDLLLALADPVIVHASGHILFVNPALLALLGYDEASQLVGKPSVELVHPDDRAYVEGRIQTEVRPNRTREHRLLARDGTSIEIDVSSIPFLFEGQLARIAFIHDLREQKRIESELALSERLASLGRLSSAVGHEINNPLTYVLGALEILDRDLADQRDLRARVVLAREGAERVRDNVRDMRSLSMAEDDTTASGCDLRRVIELAAATAAHEIRHRARLVIDIGLAPHVAGTEGRLIQVFVNLLVNAAQAIPEGNVEDNEIRVRVWPQGNNFVVEVSDTGSGISETDAHRIFEPFFTTKPSGSGTGLGLAIVQRIVASVGGTIGAEPRSPKGSTFRVTLPRFSSLSKPTSSVPPPQVSRARVLIADDEQLIGRIAKQLLDSHEVISVESGRGVIDLLQRGDRFDAIVCDLQMRELGGADVYEWVVATRPELERRLAFMTGGAFTPRAQSFLDHSRRPYLEKPFDSRALLDLVANLLAATEH